MVFRLAAMHSQYFEPRRERRIVGGAHPGIAKRPQVLARKKRKAPDNPDAAGTPPVVFRADSLRSVFYHLQPMAARNLHQRIHIRHLPEQMHRQKNSDRPTAVSIDKLSV